MSKSSEWFALERLGVEHCLSPIHTNPHQCSWPDLVRAQVGMSRENGGGFWYHSHWAVSLSCLGRTIGGAYPNVTTDLLSFSMRTRKCCLWQRWLQTGFLNGADVTLPDASLEPPGPVLDNRQPPQRLSPVAPLTFPALPSPQPQDIHHVGEQLRVE